MANLDAGYYTCVKKSDGNYTFYTKDGADDKVNTRQVTKDEIGCVVTDMKYKFIKAKDIQPKFV